MQSMPVSVMKLIDFVMGLGRMLNCVHVNGLDQAGIAIGVNESEQNLVDVECLEPYICPKLDPNHY